MSASFSLADLERRIAERAAADPAESWTARLVAGGTGRASQKFGEEAVEAVIAAVSGDRDALVAESADLLYHWLVVLHVAGIPLSDVMEELARRQGRSGLAEKAARGEG